MKGLLLKDWYQAKRYCRFIPILVLVFLTVWCLDEEMSMFIAYICMFAGMIPVTLLSYDERSKWSVYGLTLPHTRSQFVSVKYLIGLISEGLVLLLIVAVYFVRATFAGVFTMEAFADTLAVLIAIGCAAPALVLPFLFKFGVEKGRIAYFVMVGIIAGVTGGISTNSTVSGGASAVSTMTLLAVCIIAVVVYVLSWRLSVRFYEKKEF